MIRITFFLIFSYFLLHNIFGQPALITYKDSTEIHTKIQAHSSNALLTTAGNIKFSEIVKIGFEVIDEKYNSLYEKLQANSILIYYGVEIEIPELKRPEGFAKIVIYNTRSLLGVGHVRMLITVDGMELCTLKGSNYFEYIIPLGSNLKIFNTLGDLIYQCKVLPSAINKIYYLRIGTVLLWQIQEVPERVAKIDIDRGAYKLAPCTNPDHISNTSFSPEEVEIDESLPVGFAKVVILGGVHGKIFANGELVYNFKDCKIRKHELGNSWKFKEIIFPMGDVILSDLRKEKEKIIGANTFQLQSQGVYYSIDTILEITKRHALCLIDYYKMEKLECNP